MKFIYQLSVCLIVIMINLLSTRVTSLCANAGSGCHDTGCRLHGGLCNSACVCVQREGIPEIYSQCFGFGSI
uniref:CC domain-containing protein n=1 Tax=Strongyloides venezuelensis TaxID=75913 RepID=A0A0K0F425_STRVS